MLILLSHEPLKVYKNKTEHPVHFLGIHFSISYEIEIFALTEKRKPNL